MKTPKEFYQNVIFNIHPNAMTETSVLTALMQQYAEYYHKEMSKKTQRENFRGQER
jgi:hypothetical protein